MPGLEIIGATFGTLDYFKNVTAQLQGDIKNNKLKKIYHHKDFGNDPRWGKNKTLKITYKHNDTEKTVEVTEELDGYHAIRVNLP